eukprot:TRINITY_DN1829_c1_g1_i3.p1 TRINITY_DN1829_c1_g1~~TRINITY_DN1829_c1_g1_i3.p1  ORF type:complete len:548 (+),score=136.23 TRINITY_DN1829_c1_g1_i3:71-1645(+)
MERGGAPVRVKIVWSPEPAVGAAAAGRGSPLRVSRVVLVPPASTCAELARAQAAALHSRCGLPPPEGGSFCLEHGGSRLTPDAAVGGLACLWRARREGAEPVELELAPLPPGAEGAAAWSGEALGSPPLAAGKPPSLQLIGLASPGGTGSTSARETTAQPFAAFARGAAARPQLPSLIPVDELLGPQAEDAERAQSMQRLGTSPLAAAGRPGAAAPAAPPPAAPAKRPRSVEAAEAEALIGAAVRAIDSWCAALTARVAEAAAKLWQRAAGVEGAARHAAAAAAGARARAGDAAAETAELRAELAELREQVAAAQTLAAERESEAAAALERVAAVSALREEAAERRIASEAAGRGARELREWCSRFAAQLDGTLGELTELHAHRMQGFFDLLRGQLGPRQHAALRSPPPRAADTGRGPAPARSPAPAGAGLSSAALGRPPPSPQRRISPVRRCPSVSPARSELLQRVDECSGLFDSIRARAQSGGAESSGRLSAAGRASRTDRDVLRIYRQLHPQPRRVPAAAG